ncbi:F-box domain-containing protein [Rhexocercosporidium sp. MPI-PUGE-AT-0058]|nr:F-box domain-containing protein [Rhexocercosporidium sp. MPI-PUGE-AT-0058]
MPPKGRRSIASPETSLPVQKRARGHQSSPQAAPQTLNFVSKLSDELLIRVLHLLPLPTLLRSHLVSHRFYRLSSDSQIWKNLYYDRFVLPRALRIPGIKNAPPRDEALVFSSRRSKWLSEEVLVNRGDGKRTDWKSRYKLRHNWSRGVCEVREIRLREERSTGMLVRMAEGVVLTVDGVDGLRGWDLKGKGLIAQFGLGGEEIPTCLAVDEQDARGVLGVAVGFEDGGWRTWKLDVEKKTFVEGHRHPPSSNGTLSAVAYAFPYLLTITEEQLLSLYSFTPLALNDAALSEPKVPSEAVEEAQEGIVPGGETSLPPPAHQEDPDRPPSLDEPGQPRLLASLKSHTSWPPLSLSIRTTPTTLIASIAYTLRTYTSGYTVGLQELHLSLTTGSVIFSRLTSALPQGFTSILPSTFSTPPSPSSTSDASPGSGSRSENSCPTSLSYSHPYILATHPDNTLTLYLCTSTASTLSITSGTKLWGHTSSVSSAEITPRGKAVSVSTRGNELRVWELEGGFGSSSCGLNAGLKKRGRLGVEKSVVVKPSVSKDDRDFSDGEVHRLRDFVAETYEDDLEGSRRWVGFDDEVVIVLKESGRVGRQALMVYDFT